jgi:hypothetical protein
MTQQLANVPGLAAIQGSEVTRSVDDTSNVHSLSIQKIYDAVSAKNELSIVCAVEFRNNPAQKRRFVKHISRVNKILYERGGSKRRVACDIALNGLEIFLRR